MYSCRSDRSLLKGKFSYLIIQLKFGASGFHQVLRNVLFIVTGSIYPCKGHILLCPLQGHILLCPLQGHILLCPLQGHILLWYKALIIGYNWNSCTFADLTSLWVFCESTKAVMKVTGVHRLTTIKAKNNWNENATLKLTNFRNLINCGATALKTCTFANMV